MEIISGIERHRRWRLEEKLRIVAEAEAPGAVFALVARRFEVSRGQLWKWRTQVRSGELTAAQPVRNRCERPTSRRGFIYWTLPP